MQNFQQLLLKTCNNYEVDEDLITLYHRADTIVTEPQDREEEISHVNCTLAKCGYPKWAHFQRTV